ncbi:MAG: hypothetical protein V7K95_10770 [Nostoc sp.]
MGSGGRQERDLLNNSPSSPSSSSSPSSLNYYLYSLLAITYPITHLAASLASLEEPPFALL